MTEQPTNALGASAQIATEAEVYQDPAQAQEAQAPAPPEADHSRYMELRDRLQKEVNGVAEKISNDPDMDNGSKHLALNNLWNQAQEADKKISGLYTKELEEQVGEMERKVFGVPDRLMDSVRSAYSMASNEVDLASYEEEGFEGVRAGREKLTEMYDRASRVGDKAMQLAIYHIATERGIHDLRDRHLRTSGELTRAWEGYTAARKKLDNWNNSEEHMWGHLTGTRGITRPPELRG